MLAEYDYLLDGENGIKGCPVLNSIALEKLGMERNGARQKIADAEILPSDYMNPFDPATGTMHKTKNTVSIHWYSGAWLSPWKRFRAKLMRPLHRAFGVNAFRRFRK